MNTCFSVVEDGAVVDDAATVPGDTDNGVEVDVVDIVQNLNSFFNRCRIYNHFLKTTF